MSDRHYCLKCGRAFNYCRSCVFKPDPYKEAGYCSKECCEADLKEVIQKDVEVVITDGDTSASEKEVVVSPSFLDAPEEKVEEKIELNVVKPTYKKSSYNNQKKTQYKGAFIDENK